MKKLIALLTAVFLLLPGCGVQKTPDTGYTKYSAQFYGTFDTVVQIVGYCKTEEEFSRYAGQIKSRMEELLRQERLIPESRTHITNVS